jgi:hypothetical protein
MFERMKDGLKEDLQSLPMTRSLLAAKIHVFFQKTCFPSSLILYRSAKPTTNSEIGFLFQSATVIACIIP